MITDSQGYEHVKIDEATITTGDIELGAVEIKNSTDDTRATVGANGLYADVRNIQAGTAFIGCASVKVGGIAAGVTWIGFATVVPMPVWSKTALTSLSTVLGKTGAGLLHTINVGRVSCPTITFYDSLTPSGTVLYTIDNNYPRGGHVVDVPFDTGLSIDGVASGGDIIPNLLVSLR
jgi:hypothetical protein